MPGERVGNLGDSENGQTLVHLSTPSSSEAVTSVLTTDSITSSLLNVVAQEDVDCAVDVDRAVVHLVDDPLISTHLTSTQSTSGSVSGTGDVLSGQSIIVNSSLGGGATITSQTQTGLPFAVINNDKKGLTLKRALSGASSAGAVTKVIITHNPSTGQPQTVPIQVTGLSSSVTASTSVSGAISLIAHSMGTSSPTKTVTISSQGIVSPGKTVLAAVPGSPTKVHIPVNKVPLSPNKSPTKISLIPVPIPKSPQQNVRRTLLGGTSIALVPRTLSNAGGSGTNSIGTGTVSVVQPSNMTASPSKVIIRTVPNKTGPVKAPAHIAPVNSGPVTLQLPIEVTGASFQVPGSKFPYVRLVSPTTASSTTGNRPAGSVARVISAARPIAPATVTRPSQMKIPLPVSGIGQNVQIHQPGKAALTISGGQTVQRIILPATPTPTSLTTQPAPTITLTTPTSLAPIRPSVQTNNVNELPEIPPGARLLTPTTSMQGLSGFALVPAQYVTQVQLNKPNLVGSNTTLPASLHVNTQPAPATQLQSEVLTLGIAPASIPAPVKKNSVNGILEATGTRPRKPCNCTKSQCLKLYCDCFANGEFCHNCNCNNCANNLEHEEERSRAIKNCLERNPMAFHPKIGKGENCDGNRRHTKGCNCKRSGCLKNYCECYEAKIMCSSFCKCIGCKNFEESVERKTLMHLADAAEVRVQQQTRAKTKLSSQISSVPSKPPVSFANGERLPFALVTKDVVEATAACLLAQAEESERLKMPAVVQERMVIEEFGHCLQQIILSAKKTKDVAAAAIAAEDPDS